MSNGLLRKWKTKLLSFVVFFSLIPVKMTNNKLSVHLKFQKKNRNTSNNVNYI